MIGDHSTVPRLAGWLEKSQLEGLLIRIRIRSPHSRADANI